MTTRTPTTWDHPRVCGEHCDAFGGAVRPPGIIPAYAGNTRIRFQPTPEPWDHPRVCGEHATGASTQVNCTGSSPRMRGTPAVTEATNNTARIIPAYAGNTPAACWKSWQAWDHPRVCGEHRDRRQRATTMTGSSPHMRGTLRDRDRDVPFVGIIPAYAGNTFCSLLLSSSNGDHPRICGEHKWLRAVPSALAGSSPHMRGTLKIVIVRGDQVGIIPAYAGNTDWTVYDPVQHGDHPRICGEHSGAKSRVRRILGSSPHMRGTPPVRPVRRHSPWDHPRICGEHALMATVPIPVLGSSPHMRGTRHGRHWASLKLGIIPAYAGNTTVAHTGACKHWDHPRICGEHYKHRGSITPNPGSSPHMRGTRRLHRRIRHDPGIIPAYAGNTADIPACFVEDGDHPRICGEHRVWMGGGGGEIGSSPHMRGTLRPV